MKKLLVFTAVAATLNLMADQQMSNTSKMNDGRYDINPSAMPKVQNDMDWSIFLTAEALYWRAFEDGLDYGIEAARALNVNSNRIRGNTSVKDLEFGFDWGFRAGLGFVLPHDGWDLYFNYTYFFADSHAKSDKANDTSNALYPRWTDPLTQSFGQNVNTIDADWTLHFNQIDGTIGRKFATSRWLALKPFAGVRGIWVHEKYKLEQMGGNFSPNSITNYGKDTVDMKNKSWGVGPVVGLASQWNFAKEWSFSANAGLAILYSHVNLRQEEVVLNANTLINHVKDSFHRGQTVGDVAFALRWDHPFYDDRFHFGLQLGWEAHVFFDQNQFVRFEDNFVPGVFDKGGNLTLQGATLAASFGF
jgi:hypothetical protein